MLLNCGVGEDSTHGHHQTVNDEIRLILFFAAKDGDSLYSQQKQDRELTVAQIMISPNGRGGWTPLRPLRGLQETRVATREESGVLAPDSPVHGIFQARVLEWGAIAFPNRFPDDARGCQCPFVFCLHPHYLRIGVWASRSYQERIGKSWSFGMWHNPRGYVSTTSSGLSP